MSGIDRLGVHGVLALRTEILRQSDSIRRAAAMTGPAGAGPADAVARGTALGGVSRGTGLGGVANGPPASSTGFGQAMETAVKAVNALQADSSAAAAAYERGETHDIAAVMLSRQKSSVAFEATVQVRNRLLSAYRDIMNMPV